MTKYIKVSKDFAGYCAGNILEYDEQEVAYALTKGVGGHKYAPFDLVEALPEIFVSLKFEDSEKAIADLAETDLAELKTRFNFFAKKLFPRGDIDAIYERFVMEYENTAGQ
jgi:hypothetical protein